jgi:hypothetical protein
MTLPLSGPSPQVRIAGKIVTAMPLPPRNSMIQFAPEEPGTEGQEIGFPLDGNLTFKGADGMMVSPGRYRVITSFPMTEVTSVAINGQPAKAGDIVTLPAGDASLVLRVGPVRVAQLEGVVMDQDKPRSGIAIYLLPADGRDPATGTLQDQSDSDGSFSVEGRAGKYIGVAIEDGFDLEYAKPEVMGKYLAQGTAFEAVAGKRVQVKLEVQSRQ